VASHGASSGSSAFAFTVRLVATVGRPTARLLTRGPYLPQAPGGLTAGVAGTVYLSGTASYKGYLAKKPASGGVLSSTSDGAAFLSCGFGHQNAASKSNVSFIFTPTASASASTVTLTGFVVVTQTLWYSVSSTLPVAAGAAPLTPAPTPASGALAARPRLAAVAAAAAAAGVACAAY
jgi:hypothetical protein